jgi:hypothetical protein
MLFGFGFLSDSLNSKLYFKMKRLIKTLAVLILCTLTTVVYSQDTGYRNVGDTTSPKYIKAVIRSVPSITIEVNGHYNFGIFELSADDNGDFSSSQFVNGQNFGVRHGFGVYTALKLNLQEEGHFRLCINTSYNRFSSGVNKLLTGGNEGEYANYNIYSLGVGLENNFTPSYKFKPLIGAGILASVINGDARVYDANLLSYRDLTIIPAFRLGFMIYSGFEYLLSNKYGFNCGIRIVHANLWLKDTKVSSNPDEIYLNDQRTVPRPLYSGFRQFVWGELYLGLNYYFGITQKEYIIKRTLNQ